MNATATLPRPRSRRASFCALLLATVLALTTALSASAQAPIGGTLQDALAGAGAATTLEVIVSFEGDGPLSGSQLDALESLGLSGMYFENLPIAGVVATPAQINALANLSGVRSLWLNEELEYDNEGGTAITGVDRLRADANLRTAMGLPYSGKGIGVLVNDSGVDGTHADLQYPNHVVQNVAAQTNLHSLSSLLPITYTENVPNSDIGGGHGTHVAGIIAGTGAQSGGKYEGVAPGADIIGYGSGAALFILDTIGGFDYALTHQFQYNIRVVSNSFGSTSDVGTDFDPNHPTNIATKALADRGIVVVFSAGNSGPGEGTVTGNFKKAPWVIMVGAGDKSGHLAGFSSRGVKGNGGTVVVDGETYVWEDRPAITAPGVDIVSVRASTGDNPPDDSLDPAHAYYYTTLSGTSMSCPHVSGIVALMLEADPTLDVYDVKRILQETATNMPGRQSWETGTGYANAYAAVTEVLGIADFGATVNHYRDFNSEALISVAGTESFSIDFVPVGPTETITFEVGPEIALVTASARVSENTVALVLTDPVGNRYGSSISLPILGENIATSGPGRAGTWELTVRGIGSISGVAVDPLGVTNGTALPGTINGTLKFLQTDGFSGLSDVNGHPAEAFIQYAVSNRLVDGFADGSYDPDANLTRAALADYLVMGGGVRQFFPTDGSATFSDVGTAQAPFAEAVAARGAALKDRNHQFGGLIDASGSFDPDATVSRADLAFSVVQGLGLEAFAAGYTGDVSATFNGERVTLDDQDDIPAGLRGYVQLALELGILNARFTLEQGPFDLEPIIHATFSPNAAVTRGAYAVAASRYFDTYRQAEIDLSGSATNNRSASTGLTTDTVTDTAVPGGFTLGQNYPNPFNPSTQISFTTPESGSVRLDVYNMLGQHVRTLVDAEMGAGQHTVTFEASDLASGTYLYRLETAAQTETRRMVLVK